MTKKLRPLSLFLPFFYFKLPNSRGVKFGRSKKDVPKDFEKVANQWSKKEVSLRSGAKQLNVSHTTFSKWLKEKGYEREQ